MKNILDRANKNKNGQSTLYEKKGHIFFIAFNLHVQFLVQRIRLLC